MNDNLPGNLKKPVKVDLASIETELASLWNTADYSAGDIIRACSCNLIAFVRNRQIAEELPAVLSRVAEWHPSRSIVAYTEPDDKTGGDDIQAWLSVQCTLPALGRQQVCCEAITMAAQQRAKQSFPYAISALLIPDLPVYLYWRSFRVEDKAFIEKMARFSHLLIVDSHQCREDSDARLNVLQFLIDRPAGTEMRDLNWGRITAWRDLIAQFFDSAPTRGCLEEITEIEITRNLSAPGSIPTRTLLLTGWLASSLGWQRVSAERSGDKWVSQWDSKRGRIGVTFTGTVSDPSQPPGISSVILRTRQKAEFSVFVEKGSHSIKSTATLDGSRVEHAVPEEDLDEASLLVRELSNTGVDESFIAALAEAYKLEKAFRLCR